MFSKPLSLTLLGLAFSALTASAIPYQVEKEVVCETQSVILKTVTVTAAAVTVTAAGSSSTSKSSGSSGSGGKGSNNEGSGKAVGGTTSVAASTSTSTSKSSSSKSGKGHHHHKGSKGSKGTTTTAAAAGTTTTAAAATSNVAIVSSTDTAVSSTSTNDPQTSLELDPRVLAIGFAQDGQEVPTAGQISSLTSTNNFINFCLTVPDLPLTNGSQITTGSCNPAPIGVIPSTANMPSIKVAFPQNFGTVPANTAFNITLNAKNIQLGQFTNAQLTYFMAPQTLNDAGQIKGHTHVTVEALESIDQTTATDPTKFAFFKGIDGAADENGAVSTPLTAGLPVGDYRVCTINSSSNHQPVIVPVAQHGSLDDCAYFSAVDSGAAGTAVATGADTATATAVASSAALVAKTSSVAAKATGKSRRGKF